MKDDQRTNEPRKQNSLGSFWLSGRGLAAGAFLAAMLYFLLTEHRAPFFFQALPYVIFLLCPLMHLFMHQGHGRNRSGGSDSTTPGRPDGN